MFERIHWFVVLSIGTLGLVIHLSARSDLLTLAVLDFQNNSLFSAEELQPLQQGLADMMITTLSQVSGVKVVERRQLKALLEEMALAQSGAVDAATAQQVGKLLGAQYLLLGSFMRGFKNDLRIDVRIVKTETGETIKAEEVTGKLVDVLKLARKLGEKVLKNLKIKLSGKEKKALKKVAVNCPFEVVMKYFQALDLIDRKDYRTAARLLDGVLRECPQFQRAAVVRKHLQDALKNQK